MERRKPVPTKEDDKPRPKGLGNVPGKRGKKKEKRNTTNGEEGGHGKRKELMVEAFAERVATLAKGASKEKRKSLSKGGGGDFMESLKRGKKNVGAHSKRCSQGGERRKCGGKEGLKKKKGVQAAQGGRDVQKREKKEDLGNPDRTRVWVGGHEVGEGGKRGRSTRLGGREAEGKGKRKV